MLLGESLVFFGWFHSTIRTYLFSIIPGPENYWNTQWGRHRSAPSSSLRVQVSFYYSVLRIIFFLNSSLSYGSVTVSLHYLIRQRFFEFHTRLYSIQYEMKPFKRFLVTSSFILVYMVWHCNWSTFTAEIYCFTFYQVATI